MRCSVLVFASCVQFHKQPGKWIQIVAIKDAPEAAKVTAEDLECGEMERTVSLSQIGFLIRSHVSSNDHSLSLQIKTTPRSKGQKYLNTKQPQNPTCFNEVSIGVLKDVKSIQKTNMRLLRKAQSLMLLFYTAAVKLSLGPIQPKSVGPVNRRKAPTPQKDNKKLLFFPVVQLDSFTDLILAAELQTSPAAELECQYKINKDYFEP